VIILQTYSRSPIPICYSSKLSYRNDCNHKGGIALYGKYSNKDSNNCPVPKCVLDNSVCTSEGGRCINTNKDKCNGTDRTAILCPGGSHMKCCLPSTNSTTKRPVAVGKPKTTNTKRNHRTSRKSHKTKKSRTTKKRTHTTKKRTHTHTSKRTNTTKISIKTRKDHFIINTYHCTKQGGKYLSFLNKKSCTGRISGNCNKSQVCCIPKKNTTTKTNITKRPNTIKGINRPKTSKTKIPTKGTTKINPIGSICSYQTVKGTCIDTNVEKCDTTLIGYVREKNGCIRRIRPICSSKSNIKCCLSQKVEIVQDTAYENINVRKPKNKNLKNKN